LGKTALIVGVSSQDGSYLADLLLEKGYDVVGTNVSRTIRDVCRIAFGHVGLDWEKCVVSDPALLRPTEITPLKGDYSLAKAELGWEPRTTLEDLITLMVDADLAHFR
jgi:GDPmannose 4,6-dehydratase